MLLQVMIGGAYDTHECYQEAIEEQAFPCFPPRKNAARYKLKDEA